MIMKRILISFSFLLYLISLNLINAQYLDSDMCKRSVCIMKCCPRGQNYKVILSNFSKTCEPHTEGVYDYNDLTIYDKNFSPTAKRAADLFTIVQNDNFFDDPDVNDITLFLKHYLVEDGHLFLEDANAYDRWTVMNRSQYCMDYVVMVQDNGETIGPKVSWMVYMDPVEAEGQDITLTISAMYISCVFLILVLGVYSYLPELRNLYGLVLMAYVASQLGAFLSLATLQLLTVYQMQDDKVCCGFSYTCYFLFLASFCWMNVMSFDIWWTFRGYAKARAIHRRGEKFKFFVYCAYAWGLPAAMTVAFIILNTMDLSHVPWFITPKIPRKGCFLEGAQRFLYLYVPILILLCTNCVLFAMTAFNIWRLQRCTAVLNTSGNQAHHTHRQRFGVYMKLSVVMGISWVLEVISSFKPELIIWKVSDSYNLLIGFFIFIIFICKRKILKMLKKRWSGEIDDGKKSWRGSRRSAQSSSSSGCTSSSDTDLSNDVTMQVSFHPKGI